MAKVTPSNRRGLPLYQNILIKLFLMVYGVVFFVIGYMYSSWWIYDNVFVPYMNTWLEYEKMGIYAENMALLPIWFPILGVYTVFYWAITGYGWWRITTKTGVDLG